MDPEGQFLNEAVFRASFGGQDFSILLIRRVLTSARDQARFHAGPVESRFPEIEGQSIRLVEKDLKDSLAAGATEGEDRSIDDVFRG